jgi:hypothetical protein
MVISGETSGLASCGLVPARVDGAPAVGVSRVEVQLAVLFHHAG